MKTTLYILTCLTIPPLWGWIASAVYDRLNMRHAKDGRSPETGVDMYHI